MDGSSSTTKTCFRVGKMLRLQVFSACGGGVLHDLYLDPQSCFGALICFASRQAQCQLRILRYASSTDFHIVPSDKRESVNIGNFPT
jgi:hypothetical protein